MWWQMQWAVEAEDHHTQHTMKSPRRTQRSVKIRRVTMVQLSVALCPANVSWCVVSRLSTVAVLTIGGVRPSLLSSAKVKETALAIIVAIIVTIVVTTQCRCVVFCHWVTTSKR